MQAGHSEDQAITAINITPLVDVSLVLVIIFMITMPYMMEKAMRIQSSRQHVVPVSSVKDPILVELTDKDITVDGRSVALLELRETIRQVIAERGVDSVAVAAESKVLHGEVVHVLDEVMNSGAHDVDLVEPDTTDLGPKSKEKTHGLR